MGKIESKESFEQRRFLNNRELYALAKLSTFEQRVALTAWFVRKVNNGDIEKKSEFRSYDMIKESPGLIGLELFQKFGLAIERCHSSDPSILPKERDVSQKIVARIGCYINNAKIDLTEKQRINTQLPPFYKIPIK